MSLSLFECWTDPRDDFANGMVAMRKRFKVSEKAHSLRCQQRWKDAAAYEQIEFGLLDEFEQRVGFD